MRKMIIVLCFLVFSYLLLFAETGIVEFKYFFLRPVDQSISDFYFTDMRENRITGHQIDISKDLTYPQVNAAIYTNRTTGTYTVTLTFTPLQLVEDAMPDFWGMYKSTVYRYVNDELTAIGTVDVDVESNSGKSISFTGDNSSSADINMTFYYPISFDFSDYLEDYPAGRLEGSISIEVAT